MQSLTIETVVNYVIHLLTSLQIKDLVSPELFSKYDSILLNTTLDTMTDIVYCPRRHCQYPVTRDLNDQMAKCPVCQYAFCVHCMMVYHGVEPCKISSGMCVARFCQHK